MTTILPGQGGWFPSVVPLTERVAAEGFLPVMAELVLSTLSAMTGGASRRQSLQIPEWPQAPGRGQVQGPVGAESLSIWREEEILSLWIMGILLCDCILHIPTAGQSLKGPGIPLLSQA